MTSQPYRFNYKKISLLLLYVINSFAAFGKQIPTVLSILRTNPSYVPNVKAGTSTAISTVQTTSVTGAKDYNVQNTISLKFDLSTDTFFIAPATVRVKVTLTRWDALGTSLTTISRKLNISVNNKLNRVSLEQSSTNLTGGYKIVTSIDSIWVNGVSVKTLPRYVYVESDINLDRYYDFSVSANTSVSNTQLLVSDKDCDGINDELQITWSTPSAVPEEYQLEWTYVNNYSSSSGAYYPASNYTTDFKRNSTRITTTDNSYKISLIMPDGYVAFRVRAVGRDYSNPTNYIYGPWNLSDQVNMGSLSSVYLYTVTCHEKIKDWQYSASYAEEGKKKEIISYFDGSSHNRQTVTKSNSDKNVIVGETMYDYQGRPAINILPVPTILTCTTTGAESVIKYYPKFNQDDTAKVYSKNDFDLDAAGVCKISAAPMDTISGASQYYSGNNPNQVAQQSYLPHAKQFPFTQTEYTPDNTGRVRGVSGLGANYQLGSGKETKYFYGQPNQLQLDRLFASEAGDASHYKKNVIIDANGQVSVTYIDQQGKTIATGLAGAPPTIGVSTVTRMDSLDYAAQNQTQFTVDLFNKDANGVSHSNLTPPSNDQLNFSTQLLVPFRSKYDFSYNFQIDVLPDACLRSNVCVNCIYDLEIHVTDECGVDLVTSVSPFKQIKRTTGYVDTTGNKLTFNTTCHSPTIFKDSSKVSLLLNPGVYTVSKILKVNQLAKDYYVKKYTDSVYNSCVMTLSQFQAAELALVDTSDCYNSCASCVTALGTRDDFVSAGKGTAEEWDALYAQCTEPCRQKTLCQTTYEMLLSDVSPGGQYGKFDYATYDASNQPISVFNVNNVLKPNIIVGQQAHWKKPLMRMNGNLIAQYLDENGVRTHVTLTEVTPGNFLPPVTSTTAVFLDNSTNLKYTYPENLQNLSDFISIWNSNYAISLVTFHPEYAYYVSCIDESIKFSGDNLSSDGLDSLMFSCESFSQAVTAGFISTSYTINTFAINKVRNIWTTASGLYDPFFTNTTFQYSTTPNPITGELTTINMDGSSNYNINLQTQMNNIIYNYRVLNGTSHTMMDVAAIVARCGNNFGTSPSPSTICVAFGLDYYLTPPYSGANDTIRNKEWRLYRQFYFAEKQKLQFKRMNFYAKYCNDPNTNYYGGCNTCIGASSYDVFSSGMIAMVSGTPSSSSPYFDTSQPCAYDGYLNYPNVVKRFYDPSNTGLSTDNAAQQLYQTNAQCPIALELQLFLNNIASTNSLTPNNFTLNTLDAFSADLYDAVNFAQATGGSSSFNSYVWKPVLVGTEVLSGNICLGTATTCVFTLDKTGTSIPSFSNIIGISQLQYNSAGGSSGAFKAVAIYTTGSNTLSAIISGTSSCMDLNSCNFSQQCNTTQFGTDMAKLLSYLQASSTLSSTSTVSISADPVRNLFLTPSIKSTLGSPNTNIVYQFVSPNQWMFYDAANPSAQIIFTYSGNITSTITSFSDIKSNTGDFYTMIGRDVNGIIIGTISGEVKKATSSQTVGISLGNCGLPDPTECQEKEYKNRKDLESLVNDVLNAKPFYSNVNLYSFPNFSPLLKSYVAPSINATSSTYTSSSGTSPNFDTLTIRYTTSPANSYSSCNIVLYHYRTNGTALNFGNISNINNLTGIGSQDIEGNYYNFQAMATYVNGTNSAITDTIYGYSCWPIKNCNFCKNAVISNTVNNVYTYNFSTAFNRVTNTAYNHTNDGNFDPWWTVISTQSIDASYNAVGSPTIYAPPLQAYDINPSSGGNIFIPGTGYMSVTYNGSSSSHSQTATFRTTFTLPNPLPANKSYTLLINLRADDGPRVMTLNGTTISTATVGGQPYSGSALSVSATTLNGLSAGSNTLDLQVFDLGTFQSIAAQILVYEGGALQVCSNGPPDSAFVFPLYTKYDNPCARQKINLALQNAANKYQQYINNMVTTFANTYSQYCLGALEKFTEKYVDKEYHHTLYYYDQAGNLIKTIPPEGIEYIPVTAYTDNLEQKIINDRTNGLQNVFTTHRLPTKYIYNSLNQLTFQSIPDHDYMDVCDGINPNGLDTSLVINSVQFVTPNKGYLCGYIKNSLKQKRGYVYTTDDGGNYWTHVNGVTSGDLQKAQFTSTAIGYAVANYGLVFKTIDGGSTWDLLTSLYNPTSGTRYTGLLNDVFFNGNFGVVGGIATTTSSPIYYSNDGGYTFSQATITGFSNGDTITSLAFDGTTYMASSKNGLVGKIFTSTTGTTWSKASTAANNLKKVQFISSSLAYALGDEGTLMKLSTPISGSPIFQLVPTGMLGAFRDVYFKNVTDGVAIIDSSAGKGKIFKTFNGGITWQLLSANGEYYNSLQLYNGTNQKLIAAGNNGLLAKVLINTAPFGLTKIGTPNTNDISYADAYDGGINGLISVNVSTVSPLVSICYNAQIASPTWFSANTTILTPSILTADAKFKKVILLDSSATGPYVKGILLTTTGRLYSFYKAYSSTSIYCQSVTVSGGFSGKFFNDITASSQTFTTPIYAFDSISKQNYKITFSGSVAGSLILGNGAAITRNINAIDLDNSSTDMMMVGNSGHVEYTSNVATTTTWVDVTLNSLPVAITKIKAMTTGSFIATGIDGAVWKNYSNNTSWYLKNSGTTETLNSIAVNNSGIGLVAATNGKLFSLTSALTSNPLLTLVSSGVTNHLTDVAIEPSGISAYATVSNGQVIYMGNYNAPLPMIAAPASSYAINGVAYKGGSGAVVVGNNALIANYLGTSAMINTNLFPRGLISIHFVDDNNGFVIDSMNVIRRTTDGGASWAVITPTTGGQQLTKIFNTQLGKATIIGLNRYVATSGFTGGFLSPITMTVPASVPAGTHFYDIGYSNDMTYGFIVGSGTAALKIVGATITYLGTATTGVDFRAVHTFNNNTFIAAGTKGLISYYKNAAFKAQTSYTLPSGFSQTNVIFRDIYFHDYYTGYVVGNCGTAFKVNLTDSIGNIGTVPNIMPWKTFCSTALSMSYSTTTQTRKMDFNAIAFNNRTNLMIAGADSNIAYGTYTPNRYARLMKEQSGYFSSRFWYDKLGRLILSQNTKQYNKVDPANSTIKQAFSYTLYDALGRITEVGEKYENANIGIHQMNSIFGSYVNGFYNANAIDQAKFSDWVGSPGYRREVTKTYYDLQTILTSTYTQNNLRKRVASITYEDVYDGNDLTYNHATHFSYDIHGNVNTLWQENTKVAVTGQTIKQIDYQYDLISGKVNKVIYSSGQVDQFIHRYTYDADNRITMTETSTDNLRFDLDAKYYYYAHGPLARIEYGKNQVQGIDFAYTIQGWIKGINSNVLKKAKDIGSDGDLSFANPNGNFGRDIMGYSLSYYKGDYEAINFAKWNTASKRFEAYTTSSDLLTNSNDLYNGNIASMVSTVSKIDTLSSGVVTASRALPLGNSYRYDQLNRLKRSHSYTNIDTLNNIWQHTNATTGLYRNTFSYDANGNIKTQVKRDSIGGLTDSLVYNYEKINSKLTQNRLYHVNDFVTSTPIGFGDIKDQGVFTSTLSTINTANNYGFDEVGNLVRDKYEKIDTIRWTVYGKIKAIIRTPGSSTDNLYFDYDASGNRIAKHDYTSANVWKSSTYYLRDAQGNVMSEYTKKTISSTLSYKLNEQHIYGSNRLGIYNPGIEMIGATLLGDTSKSYLGRKQYELTNHLGNVITVISDKKIQIASTTSSTLVGSYLPDVLSCIDYYSFGSLLPGRRFNGTNYRYGFNGKEKDDEIKGNGNSVDFGDRIYDPRLGRWNSPDKLASKYPYASPYNYCLNNPIHNFDPDGNSVAPVDEKTKTQFQANVKVVFKDAIANIGEQIQFQSIGTAVVKVNGKEITVDVQGFVFTGNVNTAINSINNSGLNAEEKLSALAYLAVASSQNILYIQSPINAENAAIQTPLGKYSNFANDNQEYTNKGKTDASIVAEDGTKYSSNEDYAKTKVSDGTTSKAEVSGIANMTSASAENVDRSVKKFSAALTPLDTKVPVKVKEGNTTYKYDSNGDVKKTTR